MDLEERKRVINIGLEAVGDQVPVFAGTGSCSTDESIRLSKYVEDLGVDGLIVKVPHYPAPTQDGLYRHYKAVSEEVYTPLFVYNWPGGMGHHIDADTVIRLAEDEYIKGIKDSVTDITHTQEIVRSVGDEITVWTGFATTFLTALATGAIGTVCTIGNLIPNEVVQIHELFQEGKLEEARKKQHKILPIINIATSKPGVQLLKEGIKMRGYEVGDAREPASLVTSKLKEKLEEELKRLGKL